ncbi:MAG: class I SAM-dependent methyltransferase [Nanoarchaeota archaeon]
MKQISQKEVWDSIADTWSEYRKDGILVVEEFLKDKKGNVLDLGCGSGRNIYPIKAKVYGVDFSEKQLENASIKAKNLGVSFQGVLADAFDLPFNDEFFDSAICISTIHCIQSEDDRKEAINELFRVMKSGGELMISTWDKSRDIAKGKHEEMIGFLVDGVSYKRYYYYFTEGEFLKLLTGAGFKIIKVVKDSYTGKDNRIFRHNIEVYAKKP